MASTNLTIHGRTYRITCDDGQEEHLAFLARDVDRRVRQLGRQMAHVEESMLLVLTLLMMADEINDLQIAGPGITEANQGQALLVDHLELENAFASTIHQIAERVEQIAERMEMQ